MIQFYFLSILCNALAGYILSRGESEPEFPMQAGIKLSVDNDTFRLILGIMTIITGLFKFLSVISGDVPVVGDLLPALFGFTVGFTLLYEYFKKHTSVNLDVASIAGSFLLKNRRIIGVLSMVVALLHFLFPQVLFL
jgi:hypothetical protein